jgi:small subunit ribosomal protein S1
MTTDSTQPPESNVPFSMEDFEKALDQHDYVFQRGQVVRGKVYEYTSDGAYIDIGGKSPGFVPKSEVALTEVTNIAEVLPEDQELEFLIVREQDPEGRTVLSRRQLQVQQVWDELVEIQEQGKTIEIQVTGVNRGGVTGNVQGLRAFVPRSHLITTDELETLVGQSFRATILEVNPEDRKLVLSQREAARADLIRQIEKGQLVEGKIVNVKPYGAFVDLNGITGLLHIRQVSEGRVEGIEAFFKPQQDIKVVILDIDEWKNRISLTTKILEAYPGEILENFAGVMENAPERLAKAKAAVVQQQQQQQNPPDEQPSQPNPEA